jgi:diketogulonate reductase-like aldo/keto reductase
MARWWKVGKDNASSLMKSVIGSGYRHVDSAANYGNEKEVKKDKLNKYLDLLSQGWRRYCRGHRRWNM